jgi:FAD/FMN-containing dehydrogenase
MDAALPRMLAAAGLPNVLEPGHPDYDRRRRVWNGLFDRRPSAVVTATSVADVQRVIAVAADSGALLAVRGGGHSFPGHSTCDDGIVLDLSQMRTVVIDHDRTTARAGGGALLGDVDRAGAALEMVVPAGVVSHTGVAGLTLGGGMGWNSRRYGLTIDNLRSVELVLADGRVVTASEESESELFWAVRGGGGNFGVATSFEYHVRPLGAPAIVAWEYPTSVAREVLTGYRDLADSAADLASGFTISRDTIRMKTLWFGARDRAEATLSRFGQLASSGPLKSSPLTFWQLQCASDEALPWGRRYYAKGGFLAAIDDRVIAWLIDAVAKAPTADSDVYVIQLGGAVAQVSDDATAYSGRGAGFYWVVNGVWDDNADDAACLAWGRSTAQGLADLSLAFNYINEQSDDGTKTARHAYGADTYRRLVSVKRQYDPNNVFRLNQNIPPSDNAA